MNKKNVAIFVLVGLIVGYVLGLVLPTPQFSFKAAEPATKKITAPASSLADLQSQSRLNSALKTAMSEEGIQGFLANRGSGSINVGCAGIDFESIFRRLEEKFSADTKDESNCSIYRTVYTGEWTFEIYQSKSTGAIKVVWRFEGTEDVYFVREDCSSDVSTGGPITRRGEFILGQKPATPDWVLICKEKFTRQIVGRAGRFGLDCPCKSPDDEA